MPSCVEPYTCVVSYTTDGGPLPLRRSNASGPAGNLTFLPGQPSACTTREMTMADRIDQPTQQPSPGDVYTTAVAVAHCPTHRAQHEDAETRYEIGRAHV